MNDKLIIVGIFSIVALIYLFCTHEKKRKIPLRKKSYKKKNNYKVRINPIPLTESHMSNKDRFYETTFIKPIKESYNASKPIIVLLCHANWCHNCKSMKVIFDNLIYNNPLQNENIKFATLEEQEQNEYTHYSKSIYEYPTVLIDNNGTISKYRGARDKTALVKYIRENIG
jgi:thiol-disulfide isomerase/thioredoxin